MKILKHEIIRSVCIHCGINEQDFLSIPLDMSQNKSYNEIIEEWSKKVDKKYPCLTEEEYLAKQIIT